MRINESIKQQIKKGYYRPQDNKIIWNTLEYFYSYHEMKLVIENAMKNISSYILNSQFSY